MRAGIAVGAGMACGLAAACGLTVVGSFEPVDAGADATVLDAAIDEASASLDTGVDAAAAGLALLFDGTNDYVRVTRQVQDDFTTRRGSTPPSRAAGRTSTTASVWSTRTCSAWPTTSVPPS